jgi:KaiC/GvpD/RAD55 family RecA-like ATPase
MPVQVLGMDGPVKRIPTGVADFDAIIKGGMPVGSTVLLLGDLGAGQVEFAYTSASKLALVKENPLSSDYFLGTTAKNSYMPDKICYITFSRSKEDILQEIKISFNDDFYEAFERNVIFKDFSGQYFRKTVVPKSWGGESSSIFGEHNEENLLEALVNFMDEHAPNSLVIIDSLTDLAVSANIEVSDMVAVLRGMQRVSKKWNGIVYLILTSEILDQTKERVIMDSVDGALVFRWSKFAQSSKRQRYLYVEKFMSLLPHLDKERIARFATVVTAESGLVVIDTERVG